MRTVNIATLKNHLSRYLRQVREGEELLIRDRKLPIAKIVPLFPASYSDANDLELAASGQLRLPEGPLPESFWSMPAPRVPLKQVVTAVSAGRDGD
ncbi:MAG: type II toxin-antitoxin system Phd/YefM family antitoxin [Armatimonadota bacterium]